MEIPMIIILVIILILEVSRLVIKPTYEEITDEVEDVKSQNAKILLQVESMTKQIENNRVTTDNLINNRFSDEREYFNGKFAEEKDYFTVKFAEEKDFLQNLKHDLF